MSEYQYYRFERLDGYLDSKARHELRGISSRADITAISFQVHYNYSDLKANPDEMMLKHFDIGFYYAEWGSIISYIKLPVGTIPDAILEPEIEGFNIQQTDEWQLLVFEIEECSCYFNDENEFFLYLAGLRSELIQGDWRLVYLMWLGDAGSNDELGPMPLIWFDYDCLNEGLRAFASLYNIPLAAVKALSMLLNAKPHHPAKQSGLQLEAWLDKLAEEDKNRLLRAVFEQGQLTRHQAIAMTKKESDSKEDAYQYWLTVDEIDSFIEQAQRQIDHEEAAALAKKLASEKERKEMMLNDVYSQREHYWQQAKEQANRTCAKGYDEASSCLHKLFEAYQLKGDAAVFEHRFKQFVVDFNSRKALLKRLSDLL